MTATFPTRAAAGCFSLACFGTAVVAGLAAGRDSGAILKTAILALVIGQIVGLAASSVIARCFRDALAKHERAARARDEPRSEHVGVDAPSRGAAA